MIDHATLERLPLLRALTLAERDRLVGHLQFQRYAAGELILRQGDAGDRLFLIAEGRCEVLINANASGDGGLGHKVSELGAGECFGEVALLKDVPRTASVRTLQPTACYVLDRAGFFQLLGAAPAIRVALELIIQERLQRTHQTP
jgi:CRP-like cAMP-binding protein